MSKASHIARLEDSVNRKIEKYKLTPTKKLKEDIQNNLLNITHLKLPKIKHKYELTEEEKQAHQDKLALIDYLDDGTIPWD